MKWNNKDQIAQIINDLDKISFKGQNVLLTGGAGFLGSWICDVLLENGAKVICLDNLSSGLLSNVKHLLDLDNFTFIKHDISEVINFDNKLDLILHMASRASPFEFEYYPIEILRANTIGLLMSLEIAKKHNARILFASTSEIYGNPQIVPTPERYNGNVNPIGPRGCYDEAKRCGEAYVFAYKKQYDIDIRIARIFNTYGPRMRSDGIYGRAIPRFLDQALNNEPLTIFGDGQQTRSFTYITDQIQGLLRLAALDNARGAVVNIGNDRETTILDMGKMVLGIAESKSKMTYSSLPEDDPLRRRPDISIARELLRWSPKVSLDEGLRRTLEWFRYQKEETDRSLT
jgi:UDP-glucuronate decarboxylase